MEDGVDELTCMYTYLYWGTLTTYFQLFCSFNRATVQMSCQNEFYVNLVLYMWISVTVKRCDREASSGYFLKEICCLGNKKQPCSFPSEGQMCIAISHHLPGRAGAAHQNVSRYLFAQQELDRYSRARKNGEGRENTSAKIDGT